MIRESAANHVKQGPTIIGPGSLEAFSRFLPGEKRVWRLVLSPQEYFQLDAEVFTWSFMERLQQQAGFHGKGQYVDWLGVVHTNTGSPHIHLLIRGLDVSGNDFLLRKTTFANLRIIAADVQDTLTQGFISSRELLSERRKAGQFHRMPTYDNINLDTLVAKAPQGLDYDRILELVPRFRRQALHARLIYLEKTGLVTLDEDGKIFKTENYQAKLRGTRNLFRYLIEQGAVIYAQPRSLNLASERNSPVHGLVSSITFDPHLNETYGVLETLNDTAVAFLIDPKHLPGITEMKDQKHMVTLAKGTARVADGDVGERLDKLRAKGKVVAELRRNHPREINNETGL